MHQSTTVVDNLGTKLGQFIVLSLPQSGTFLTSVFSVKRKERTTKLSESEGRRDSSNSSSRYTVIVTVVLSVCHIICLSVRPSVRPASLPTGFTPSANYTTAVT